MKIKEEQLETIKEHQKQLNVILNEIGFLEAQKHAMMHKFGETNNMVEEFKKELETEYGPINVNIEDGSYTIIEQEKVMESV
jgi:hypothetical protein